MEERDRIHERGNTEREKLCETTRKKEKMMLERGKEKIHGKE
jgi:hypothetical protein